MSCESCQTPKVEVEYCDRCKLNLCKICDEDPDHADSHDNVQNTDD